MYNHYTGYGGYYDDGEGYSRYVKSDYSSVEVVDVLPSGKGNFLTEAELVVLHDDLPQPYVYKSYNGRYDSQCSHQANNYNYGLKPSTGKVGEYQFITPYDNSALNPTNGSVILSSSAFKLSLTSRIDSDDIDSWVYFSSVGLEIANYGVKSRESHVDAKKMSLFHRFRIELKKGATLGYVQFFQSAKQGANAGNNIDLPYGSILTYFVAAAQHNINNVDYPPLITLFPNRRQNFVALRPKQILQVILPENYQCEPLDTSNAKVIHHCSIRPNIGNYNCHYFEMKDTTALSTSFPISFSAKDTSRQGVVVVCPIEQVCGAKYAVLHSPENQCSVNAYNVYGLIFRRTLNPIQVGHITYLDRDNLFRIESQYKLMTVGCSQEVYDLRVAITDKKLYQFDIDGLVTANAKVSATSTC